MLALITCVVSVLIVGLAVVFPSLEGEPFTDQVTVQGRKFVPEHQIFAGNVIRRFPDTWTLEVGNQKGSGSVKVDQLFYDATADGDVITVTGTKGRVTKKWYLKEAYKET